MICCSVMTKIVLCGIVFENYRFAVICSGRDMFLETNSMCSCVFFKSRKENKNLWVPWPQIWRFLISTEAVE